MLVDPQNEQDSPGSKRGPRVPGGGSQRCWQEVDFDPHPCLLLLWRQHTRNHEGKSLTLAGFKVVAADGGEAHPALGQNSPGIAHVVAHNAQTPPDLDSWKLSRSM